MEGADGCNVVVGPVWGGGSRLRGILGSRTQVQGPNHILLPRSQRKFAFALESVLRAKECDALVEASEHIGFHVAGVGGEMKQVVNTDVRSSFRLLSDDPVLAASLWSRIRDHVPVVQRCRRVLGLNERLRFLRYTEGQRFAPHYDGTFERKGTLNRSFLTFQVYLSDSAAIGGGATRFVGGASLDDGVQHADVDCAPEQGRALIFAHNILHEGAVVTSGVKYTIRTDIEYSGPSVWAAVQAFLGFGGSPSQNRQRAALVAQILIVLLSIVILTLRIA